MPNTYISYQDIFSVGQQQYRTANIPFPFLNKEDIKVTATRTSPSVLSPTIWTYVTEDYFNSTFVNGESSLPFGNYCVINENGQNKIKYKSASGNETYTITIYRRTFSSRTSQFTNGSPLQASDLNDLLLKSSYASEEAIEAVDAINSFGLSASLNNKYDKSGGTISGHLQSDTLSVIGNAVFNSNVGVVGGSINLPFDLSGTLRNVPTPAYPNDAVNKAYVDSLTLNGGSPPVIENDAITAEKLRKVAGEQAVTTSTIRDLAVTGAKIANTTITGGKIASFTITSTQLASNSVTTSKITAGNVTSTSLADNAVTTAKISDNSITSAKLQSAVITTEKLANGSVTLEKVAVPASGLFDGSFISNNTIDDDKLTAPISWGNTPKITTYSGYQTKIDSNLTITGSIVNAENADVKLKSVTPLLVATGGDNNNILNQTGSVGLQSGGLSPNPSSSAFNYQHLNNFNDQPVFFRVYDSQTKKQGYYDFEIYVPSKNTFKPGATTIFQHVSELNYYINQGVYGGGAIIANRYPFAYKTLDNIPFNNTRPDSENSHIYLNTQNKTIVFGAIPTEAKYRIDLHGVCCCNRNTGQMFIRPLTNVRSSGPGLESPLSTLFFTFNSTQNVNFSVTTLLTIPQNSSYTRGVEYYYTDQGSSLPSLANWDPFVTWGGTDFASGWRFPNPPPQAWGNWSYNNLVEANIAYIQLIIQRIS